MVDGTSLLIIYGVVVSAISFLAVFFMTPIAIKSLTAKGKVVPDAHKPNKPSVPRPAGPVLMAGIAAAEIVLYAMTLNTAVLAVLLTTAIAFAIVSRMASAAGPLGISSKATSPWAASLSPCWRLQSRWLSSARMTTTST